MNDQCQAAARRSPPAAQAPALLVLMWHWLSSTANVGAAFRKPTPPAMLPRTGASIFFIAIPFLGGTQQPDAALPGARVLLQVGTAGRLGPGPGG